MNSTRLPEAGGTAASHGLLLAARSCLGGRRGLMVLAGSALVAGLALNWSWLVAAGLAPILIGVLPCIAMCALGLCLHRAAGTPCAPAAGGRPPGDGANNATTAMREAGPAGLPVAPAARLASSGAAPAPHTAPGARPAEGRSGRG